MFDIKSTAVHGHVEFCRFFDLEIQFYGQKLNLIGSELWCTQMVFQTVNKKQFYSHIISSCRALSGQHMRLRKKIWKNVSAAIVPCTVNNANQIRM